VPELRCPLLVVPIGKSHNQAEQKKITGCLYRVRSKGRDEGRREGRRERQGGCPKIMPTTTTAKRKTKKAQQPQLTIQGIVTKRIFYNAENGYCVLSVKPRIEETSEGSFNLDIQDEIKATGSMPAVREGDEYKFIGHHTSHPKYGPQFKFSQAELILPSGKAGIARYLSGVTPGVGIKKAQRIVEALGEDALELIQQDPAMLEHPDLSFLTEQQKEDIAQDLSQNSIQAELAGMIVRDGVGMGTVSKIMQKYGNDAVQVVKENPYILADEVWGIGFKKADEIAQAVGVESNSPFRVEAAINYLLQEAGSEGHVYLEPATIVQKCLGRKGLLEASGVDVPMIAAANNKIIDEGRCVREGDAVYAKSLYEAETTTAAAVRMLAENDVAHDDALDRLINLMEQKYGVEYAPEQREAVATALQSGISIITGGPGTGKTTVIRAICDIYSMQNIANELYLCAPTGRAAKRMEEATGYKAKTIHRLLKYSPELGGFRYGYGQPLPGPGLLVVDEASMMDIELASCLLGACENLQVVMVGDVDQLPSVGPGSVLRDCIASGRVATVRLGYNYRQAGGSRIAELADLVCRGEVPDLQSAGDFEFIGVGDADQGAQTVLQLVQGVVAEGYGLLDWAVLAPMRRGSCGVNTLNEQLRELVNPARTEEATLGHYRLGDKVMVIKNNYHLEVFNGDLGIVADVHKNKLTVGFEDGRTVGFAAENLGLLTLAYATTIHKSQGSEFPIVIMPLVYQHYIMLQRNLLYTGMTRAKRRLVLVAEERSIKRAVQNNVIEKRFSMLAERICGERSRGA
jgi:exodeoxyribonuclease V alpha subunit